MTGEARPPVGQGTGAPSPRAADDEISLWEVLAVLLRQRRWIVRSVVVCAGLAVTLAFVRARTYTTSASFRPQGAGGASELTALASQFGVTVGGSEEGESPAFYQELLGSREILSRVATADYAAAGVTGTLPVLLRIEEETPDLELARAVEWLEEEAVSVSTGRETGTVTVSVTTEWPEVSEGIARHLLDEVSRFNLETRQSQAGAERTFIEERVTAAEESLRQAEAALQAFSRNNRIVGEFSEARLEIDRLQREVMNRQQVYTTLVQSYEQARISEVRDTPVITVLQQPFLPPEPDGRGLVLGFALGVVLGGMLGVVLAFLAEVFGRSGRAADPARRDFDEEWAGFLDSLPIGRSS